MQNSIDIVLGDITTLEVDAIVNAANRSLMGGNGVDGAIHDAAGPKLVEECEKLGGCPTGEARITKAYKLKAKYVIHAVGPVWQDGDHNEPKLLKNAYINSFQLAKEKKLDSIAFPNISTGAYRFPKRRAARLAIETARDFISKNKYPKKVIFVCFDEENFNLYNEMINNVSS
jgi:O-acetyl-ADP-ribose deacetylase